MELIFQVKLVMLGGQYNAQQTRRQAEVLAQTVLDELVTAPDSLLDAVLVEYDGLSVLASVPTRDAMHPAEMVKMRRFVRHRQAKQ